MGIMAMKPKSSGLEGLGLGIDNGKENPRPSQRSSRQKGRLADCQERVWAEGGAFPATRGAVSSGAGALWGTSNNS